MRRRAPGSLVRDHPGSLGRRAEDPSAQPAAWISLADPRTRPRERSTFPGRPSRSGSSWPLPTTRNGISGASALQRGSCRARAAGSACPRRGRGRRLGCADERGGPRRRRSRPDRSPRGRTVREELSMGLRVGNDTSARRTPTVDDMDDPGRGEPRPKRPRSLTSVSNSETADEDDRSSAGDALAAEGRSGRGSRRLARPRPARRPGARRLRSASATRSIGLRPTDQLRRSLPDSPVCSRIDAGATQRGDRLRIARVRAIVGAEVEDAHRPYVSRSTSSTTRAARSAPPYVPRGGS